MPPEGTYKGMGGRSRYVSRQPDANGLIDYTPEEHAVWRDLISRQVPMLPGRACPPWIGALNAMNFPMERIPQLSEISAVLRAHTGWAVAPDASATAISAFSNFS